MLSTRTAPHKLLINNNYNYIYQHHNRLYATSKLYIAKCLAVIINNRLYSILNNKPTCQTLIVLAME
ncbi:hypothetical protein RhiirA5_434893 [Rhizophagus irregularis]|uniref:Uncharacterized protein n=1 Tax=Rhizophagus irregularis TaxID=588596 RepID=A0A2N0NP81_9GLOM|nr:hypothetical protein RhiirA5_434926 [Rhizophagus irregularis]PKB96405.1 hypothetical protein RhiirA5_434893 [Rhizophagus irregularis]GET60690.1 hypothetical protein RIR_jg2390.t1 [Rhizophagus irregularis DAOM 181602=DAOM 197198]